MQTERKFDFVHIIGGGIAGLSAAVFLVKRGINVKVYEAGSYAGGRCRSYFDDKLGMEIDNGNHLLLKANKEALRLIKEIGAEHTLLRTKNIPFVDLAKRSKWRFPNIPDVKISEYSTALSLAFAGNKTVRQCVASSPLLYRRLWKPLCVSLLNTPPEIASAKMFRDVMARILLGGSSAYTPKHSWDKSLIEPALRYIGDKIETNRVVKKIRAKKGRITAIDDVKIGKNEAVIIAVPPHVLKKFMPKISTLAQAHAIVNIHFKYDYKKISGFLGIVGEDTHWLFFKKNIISTTTSAADDMVKKSEKEIAKATWKVIKNALRIEDDIPPFRVIKEKRATFSCTNENLKKRPGHKTPYDNLFIAGDFTDTGLPATIEGAVVSGKKAAYCII